MLLFDGRRDAPSVLLRVAIVGLTLSAYIHFTLGDMMFLANAAGLPSRWRWR
jgi:hypothetical protein